MSTTLILWKRPLVPDACAAEVLLQRWYKRRNDRDFEPSDSMAAFARELLLRHPEPPKGQPGGPWAEFPFTQTDRVIELSLKRSADPQVLDDISSVAQEHELLLYDPQSGDIYLPGDPAEAEKIPPVKLMDLVRAAAMVAPFAGLTWLAWQIPFGWLRWPLVGVGAFVTAAALFVVLAMVAGVLGLVGETQRSPSLN